MIRQAFGRSRVVSALTILCSCLVLGASVPDENVSLVYKDTYVATGGILEIVLDGELLSATAPSDVVDASPVGDRISRRFQMTHVTDTYTIVASGDAVERYLGGEITADGAFHFSQFGKTVLSGTAIVLVHDAFGQSDREFSVYADSKDGLRLFTLSVAQASFDSDNGLFGINAGLAIAPELAQHLGDKSLAGMRAGRFAVSINVSLTESVALNAEGDVESFTMYPQPTQPAEGFPNPGPDVIVGDLPSTGQEGRTGTYPNGQVGLAVATTSCNKGDTPFNWFALPNGDHPMIPMNLYRLKTVSGSERFEQVGYSWMKHGFFALQLNACGFGCTDPGAGGTLLGVGCSDPYSQSRNGSFCGLGPRAQLNPYTGVTPGGGNLGGSPCSSSNFPSRDHRGHAHGGVTHRLQVMDQDLIPSLNTGARYFSEGQYLTPHEFNNAQAFAAQNMHNNASYRELSVTDSNNNGNPFGFNNVGATVREQPAVNAWTTATQVMIEPAPTVDGRGSLSYRVTDLGGGQFHYEYAVHNQNMDRSMREFSVPIPAGVLLTNIDMHFPPNHNDAGVSASEQYSNVPWTVSTTGGAITWATQTVGQNAQANAIRFGTLYNFRFDANSGPQAVNSTVGFFKTGGSMAVATQGPLAVGPQDCNNNGVEDGMDIANGDVQDCNGNGIPDECEALCQLTSRRIVAGLSSPTGVFAPPGDLNRLFAVQQGGRIRIIDLNTESVLGADYINLSGIITSGGEQGLLSMAFDPNWNANGRFYVNYTNTSGNTVVARYTATGGNPASNTADSGSALILKTIVQDFANHNGGQLQFGPDGMLYVGMGDGGAADDPNNRAQNTSSLLGKMLRLDVNAAPPYIPVDNPFVGPGAPLDEIWALGLRNPWRFSFDRLTGDMYIGDVGQDAREEIDFQPAASTGGENYGWDCEEGFICTPTNSGGYGCVCGAAGLTDPIYDVAHTGGFPSPCSITGGFVYRGCDIIGLSGTYFVSDFCDDSIQTFRYDGTTLTDFADRTVELQPDIGSISSVVSFGEDASGELYWVSQGGSVNKIECNNPAVCGNSVIETGEDCDPPDGTTCDANCQFIAPCDFVVFADDFQTDQGWVPTNLGASTGDWERGVPVNDPGWDFDPLSDSDGSGQCFLTQNQAGNTDVDGGSVRLNSPDINMSGGGIRIEYDYYLNLTNSDGTDRLLVEISSNGVAGPWTQVALHTTDGGTSWRSNLITQADLDLAGITLTANMQLRYTINDTGAASIVEGGLDAFRVCSSIVDCNGNGIDDAVDIANCPIGDTSCDDCNSNGIPDGCDVDISDPDGNGVASADCDGGPVGNVTDGQTLLLANCQFCHNVDGTGGMGFPGPNIRDHRRDFIWTFFASGDHPGGQFLGFVQQDFADLEAFLSDTGSHGRPDLVPDECQTLADCDNDGQSDGCELEARTQFDVDPAYNPGGNPSGPNGVPDDCECIEPCSDSDACTIGDACVGLACIGTPVDCSGAGDDCNAASCDAAGADGNCATLTFINEGGACNGGTGICDMGVCVDPGATRVFMARTGQQAGAPAFGPTSMTMAAGTTATIEIWVADTDPELLNGYQIAIPGAASPDVGAAGMISYVDISPGVPGGDSVFIDTARSDWAFIAQAPAVFYAEGGLPAGFAFASGLTFGTGLSINGLAYLGEFDVSASPDATGSFTLGFVPVGQPPDGGTGLNDSAGLQIFAQYQTLNIVIGEEMCTTATDCGDAIVVDGVVDDQCMFYACNGNACSATPRVYGDVGGPFGDCNPDGFPNIFDANLVLACFAQVSPCDVINIDVGSDFGACPADGFCNVFDVNLILLAFAEVSTCSCPADGPAPVVAPTIVSQTGLTLAADRRLATPGDTVTVTVHLKGEQANLQSYQLDAAVSGGRRGRLELVDLQIESRADYVFARRTDVLTASNVDRQQLLASLIGGGMRAKASGYLATLTYRVSDDAAGTFVIDIPLDGQTYFVADGDGKIELTSTSPAVVVVSTGQARAVR